jgi:hypothetical protein
MPPSSRYRYDYTASGGFGSKSRGMDCRIGKTTRLSRHCGRPIRTGALLMKDEMVEFVKGDVFTYVPEAIVASQGVDSMTARRDTWMFSIAGVAGIRLPI